MRMKAFLLGILLSLAASLAQAQAFPSRPVMLLITFPAGGPTDVAGRALAEATSKYLGQPVLWSTARCARWRRR
jgi:tripartite-type tricarboxylate transporter receptor subunit TctC